MRDPTLPRILNISFCMISCSTPAAATRRRPRWWTLPADAASLTRRRRDRRVSGSRPDRRQRQARRCRRHFLANSWEFCTAFHAIQLAGADFRLCSTQPIADAKSVISSKNSGAVGLDNRRRKHRRHQPCRAAQPPPRLHHAPAVSGTEPFANLLNPVTAVYPKPDQPSDSALAALPYSERHHGPAQGCDALALQSVSNVYQLLGPMEPRSTPPTTFSAVFRSHHIYGLNVVLNPSLILGATLNSHAAPFTVPMMTKLIIRRSGHHDAARASPPCIPCARAGRGRTVSRATIEYTGSNPGRTPRS